jgi:hypothetical protein
MNALFSFLGALRDSWATISFTPIYWVVEAWKRLKMLLFPTEEHKMIYRSAYAEQEQQTEVALHLGALMFWWPISLIWGIVCLFVMIILGIATIVALIIPTTVALIVTVILGLPWAAISGLFWLGAGFDRVVMGRWDKEMYTDSKIAEYVASGAAICALPGLVAWVLIVNPIWEYVRNTATMNVLLKKTETVGFVQFGLIIGYGLVINFTNTVPQSWVALATIARTIAVFAITVEAIEIVIEALGALMFWPLDEYNKFSDRAYERRPLPAKPSFSVSHWPDWLENSFLTRMAEHIIKTGFGISGSPAKIRVWFAVSIIGWATEVITSLQGNTILAYALSAIALIFTLELAVVDFPNYFWPDVASREAFLHPKEERKALEA